MDSEDIFVQSVQFRPDGVVEITYSETNDQSDSIGIVKIMMIEAKLLEGPISDLMSDLIDLIALGERELHPPRARPSGLKQ